MKSNIALSLGLAALVGLGAILPAAAATTGSSSTSATTGSTAAAPAKSASRYYVSLKSKGPGCEIVSVKPTTKLMVGKHSFSSEAAATKAMAGDKACKA